jgi:hypothetical protein
MLALASFGLELINSDFTKWKWWFSEGFGVSSAFRLGLSLIYYQKNLSQFFKRISVSRRLRKNLSFLMLYT